MPLWYSKILRVAPDQGTLGDDVWAQLDVTGPDRRTKPANRRGPVWEGRLCKEECRRGAIEPPLSWLKHCGKWGRQETDVTVPHVPGDRLRQVRDRMVRRGPWQWDWYIVPVAAFTKMFRTTDRLGPEVCKWGLARCAKCGTLPSTMLG